MAVRSIFWPTNTGNDYHLVPGLQSPRLDQLLWIDDDSAGTVRADAPPAGIGVAFAPNFVAGPGTAGIAVDVATGEVTVAATLPAAPRLLDFVVTATVTGAAVDPAYIRFHVHGAIKRTWLTPSRLTVRQGARNLRFTVLAEFDDGTFGDITNWSPPGPLAAGDRTYVRVAGRQAPVFVWSTNAPLDPITQLPTIDVDPVTGRLTGNASGAVNVGVFAALPGLPRPPAHVQNGRADGAGPWTSGATLELIDGPGFAQMASVPNILILPDGFQDVPGDADRTAFAKLARQIVQRLRVRRRTRPFDLCKDRLNYFMAWVPSADAGISALALVQRFNADVHGRAEAVEVETAVDAAALPGAWQVAAPSTPATNTLFLLSERDTAFHSVLGERPRAQRNYQLRSAYPHPLRFDEQDLDDFLGALRDPGGTPVGAVWMRKDALVPPPRGKDEGLILLLARTLRYGGGNFSRSPSGHRICMTLSWAAEHRIEDNAGQFGKDLRPDPVPDRIIIETWTTAAHELAHSFTLGDEYGGGGTLPAAVAGELAAYANLQLHADLLTGGNLDADKIKWRWPRIAKAGVLRTSPTFTGVVTGGMGYSLFLEAGQGAAFAEGDTIRLRTRPLLTSGALSAPLAVTNIAGDLISVVLHAGDPFSSTGYAAGSVALAQTLDAQGGGLELVAASTRARINTPTVRNPLNALDTDPPNRPCPGIKLTVPTLASNYPGGQAPRPPRNSAWIVGLFENAHGYDCGAYHPTGACLMNEQYYRAKPLALWRAYPFCPVCRYAMVDLLDPSKHGEIDRDYAGRYPR